MSESPRLFFSLNNTAPSLNTFLPGFDLADDADWSKTQRFPLKEEQTIKAGRILCEEGVTGLRKKLAGDVVIISGEVKNFKPGQARELISSKEAMVAKLKEAFGPTVEVVGLTTKKALKILQHLH
jgi:hypothetical protein